MVADATRRLDEATNGTDELGEVTNGQDNATSEWGQAKNSLDNATNELDRIKKDIQRWQDEATKWRRAPPMTCWRPTNSYDFLALKNPNCNVYFVHGT